MILIVVLALTLRSIGIGFGLPNPQHAYSYNPDEWTLLRALQGMDPRRLDLNPHYFESPTFFYYLLGASCFAAHLAGAVRLDGDERFYFAHPEHLARMIAVGRLLVVLFAVATVWLLYRLARRLGLSRETSQLAALILAIHPSHVVHSHFLAVNVPVTFWITATFLLVTRWLQRGGGWSAAAAGAVAGLALSTKYSAVLLLPVLVAGAGLRALRGGGAAGVSEAAREGMIAVGVAVAAFVAGSPYTVLAFPEFLSQVSPFIRGMLGARNDPSAWHSPTSDMAAWISRVHLAASTPLLLAASLGGAWRLVREPRAAPLLMLGWLVTFLLLSQRAAHLATDSRFLPTFPLVALLGAIGLEALGSRRRRLGQAAAALVVLVELAWTGVLLGRFVGPMPQAETSRWAELHVGPRERVLLTGTASYWSADLPLREYLHARNRGNYERVTDWVFVNQDSFALPYARVRALEPDVVFLTAWLPMGTRGMEWLADPGYRVVASFPGKVHLFGRRIHVPLDLYDVDIWVLRPRERRRS
jgi:dolichyl-phosphate-mannose-protein mannosyltransferase